MFNYIDNNVIKNKNMISLDLNITLDTYNFNLHAAVVHHEPSTCGSHCIVFVNDCGKSWYCNDEIIVDYDV